jgi:hypothetical protein
MAKSASPAASAADSKQMMDTIKPLYSDLHVALTVEVQGGITQTNAAYVNGSTVTLLDMDFAKILADDAAFKKLSAAGQSQSMADVKKLVKSMPGVTIDTQDSVSVKFK